MKFSNSHKENSRNRYIAEQNRLFNARPEGVKKWISAAEYVPHPNSENEIENKIRKSKKSLNRREDACSIYLLMKGHSKIVEQHYHIDIDLDSINGIK